ncbi:uncharacterized protein LOC114460407 [Gouania willdenowi]|uniref:uncharacterized protein LOC114460407 n=1 Tax=Gouania willdenowi TaxID=441366 RepID=UPI001055C608|nr:uncharacterized protein LOC114460407 [Gouania willdenowi]
MSLERHSKQLIRNCFFHLRNISKLRHIVSGPELEMVIHAFVSSRALHGQAPEYIEGLIQPYVSNRSLRSSSQNLLMVPRTRFKTRGTLSHQFQRPPTRRELSSPQLLRKAFLISEVENIEDYRTQIMSTFGKVLKYDSTRKSKDCGLQHFLHQQIPFARNSLARENVPQFENHCNSSYTSPCSRKVLFFQPHIFPLMCEWATDNFELGIVKSSLTHS